MNVTHSALFVCIYFSAHEAANWTSRIHLNCFLHKTTHRKTVFPSSFHQAASLSPCCLFLMTPTTKLSYYINLCTCERKREKTSIFSPLVGPKTFISFVTSIICTCGKTRCCLELLSQCCPQVLELLPQLLHLGVECIAQLAEFLYGPPKRERERRDETRRERTVEKVGVQADVNVSRRNMERCSRARLHSLSRSGYEKERLVKHSDAPSCTMQPGYRGCPSSPASRA